MSSLNLTLPILSTTCVFRWPVNWASGHIPSFIRNQVSPLSVEWKHLVFTRDGVVYVIYFLSYRITWYHIQSPDWWGWCGICYLFLVLQDCLISYSVTWLVGMVWYMLFISCPTGLPDIIFSYLIGGDGVVYVIYFLSYRIAWYHIQLPDWWGWCGICYLFLVLQDCLISYSVTWLVGMVWYMLFISCPTGLSDIVFSYLIGGDGVAYVIYFLSYRISWYHIQLLDWWEWCGICYLFLVLQDCLISYSVTWLVEMVWYMLFIYCPTGLPDIIFSYLIGGNGVVYVFVFFFLSYRIAWYHIQLPDWWEWCGNCYLFLVLQDCLISYSVTWLVGMVWYMLFISCPTGFPDIIFSYLIGGNGVVIVIYFLSYRIAWYHIQLPDWWGWCGICYLFLVLQDCLISYSVTWLVGMVWYMLFMSCPTGLPDIIFSYLIGGDGVVYVIYVLSYRIAWYHIQLPDWWGWCGICYLFLVLQDCLISYSVTWLVGMVWYMLYCPLQLNLGPTFWRITK